MITSVWSCYGHQFMFSTDCEEHESCLTCGAMYVLAVDSANPTRGDYVTAAGEAPQHCTYDTMMVHGYPGERHCDACRNEGCSHCRHDCPCVSCDS